MLAVIGLGAFFTALDQTVVVTVLPAVMLDLRIPIGELDRVSWVVTAYLLGYTAFMPLFGRLADVYGLPRLYIAGLLIFAAGSVLVALSRTLEELIGARVIQAVGGSAAVPIGFALAVSAVPRERQGLALGIVAGPPKPAPCWGRPTGRHRGTGQLAMALLAEPAPGVDGGAVAAAPPQPSAGRGAGGLPGRRAGPGNAAGPVPGPVPEKVVHPGLALALRLAGGGVGAGGGAGPMGAASPPPLLLPLLFRTVNFVTANLTQLLVGVSLVIALVTVPLMANTVMGKDPFTGALWLLRMTAAIPIGAVAGGLLLSRVGNRPVIAAGLLSIALGLFLVSGWPLDVSEPELTMHLLLAGLGFGLVIAPIMAQALNAAPPEYHATASSMVVVARLMGMTLGLAALAAYGIGHFQSLTGELMLPLPISGEPRRRRRRGWPPTLLSCKTRAWTCSTDSSGLPRWWRCWH